MVNLNPINGYNAAGAVPTTVTTETNSADNNVAAPNASPSKTTENNLQETQFEDEEELDLTPDSVRNQITTQLQETTDEYDNRIKQYYLQIEQLRNQLRDIEQQRYSLIQKMASGTGANEIQNEMSNLDNQAKTINSNIDAIFLNILSLEDELENARATANNALNELNALTGAQSAGDMTQNAPVTFNGKRTTSNPTATKLADTVVSIINANGSTTGWCLRGVNRALQKAYGFSFAYGSAYQALGELQSRPEFEEITNQYPNKSDLKNLPAGAIVIWGRNDAHPHGHISIALGDGREASDHIANQYTNSGGGYHIFMPKDIS